MSKGFRSSRSAPPPHSSRNPHRLPLPEAVERALQEAARLDVPVRLTGETGTGKTTAARMLHELGPRASRPFIPVNCGALPPTLIDAELFGREAGAWTDARYAAPGRIALANGGTLLLDDVTELPLELQSRFLQVVESGVLWRIGAKQETRVDVRFICATNRDIEALIKCREFRQDLYYRFPYPIHLPPLRERPEDIPRIVQYLLKKIATLPHSEVTVSEMHPEVFSMLRRHPWPGNIRELETALILARSRAQGGRIEVIHFPNDIVHPRMEANSLSLDRSERPKPPGHIPYKAPATEEEERANIVSALRLTGGNKTRAARRLGMSRALIFQRVKYYRINDEDWRDDARPNLSFA